MEKMSKGFTVQKGGPLRKASKEVELQRKEAQTPTVGQKVRIVDCGDYPWAVGLIGTVVGIDESLGLEFPILVEFDPPHEGTTGFRLSEVQVVAQSVATAQRTYPITDEIINDLKALFHDPVMYFILMDVISDTIGYRPRSALDGLDRIRDQGEIVIREEYLNRFPSLARGMKAL